MSLTVEEEETMENNGLEVKLMYRVSRNWQQVQS